MSEVQEQHRKKNKKNKNASCGGCVTSGAGASVLQVKAQRTLAAEGASCVRAAGAQGTGAAAALVHVCHVWGKCDASSRVIDLLADSGRAEERSRSSPWLQVGPVQDC